MAILKRTTLAGVPVLLLSIAGAATRPAVPASAPARPATAPAAALDLSTPKSAAKAYADVVIGGALGADPKAIRRVTVGDERSFEQAEAAAGHAAASYDLAAAVAARFGEEGRRYAAGRADDHKKLLGLIDRARLSLDGDLATFAATDSDWQMSLKRVDNRWRVVLPPAIDDRDAHAKAVRWTNGQAALVRALTAEVRAGKFASVKDVDAALRERGKQLTDEMLNAGKK